MINTDNNSINEINNYWLQPIPRWQSLLAMYGAWLLTALAMWFFR